METSPGGGRTAPGWGAALATLAAAACVLGLGAVQGADAMVGAALVSLLLVAVALVVVNSKAQAAVLSWPAVVGGLVLIVWLIPVKGYSIDVPLGFQLVAYRAGIMVVVFAWISAAFVGLAPRPSGLGRRGVLIALLGIGAISIAVNAGPISRMGLDASSQKTLLELAGFVFVFVMVGSMLKAERDIRAVAQVLVLGGSVVALVALYEFYTGFNAFHHLSSALPGFTYSGSPLEKTRSGLIRVRGSAQHPIALAGALALCLPLGAYLAYTASSVRRRHAWILLDVLLFAAAAATVSRTFVIILIAMSAAAVAVWGQRLSRTLWMLVVLGLVGLVAAAPATCLDPIIEVKGAIHQVRDVRANRDRDGWQICSPGYHYWLAAPLLGHGVGTQTSTAGDVHAKGEPGFTVGDHL